jgi:hypothetical protein
MHRSNRLRLQFYLVVFFIVLVTGTIAFSMIEGHSLLNSLYFTIVTMATVGYGDIHPVTDAGKLVAIVLIIAGVSTFLGVVANATEIFINRREHEARLQKLHMIIGLFFSESGTKLMEVFVQADSRIDAMRESMIVRDGWSSKEFARTRQSARTHEFKADSRSIDLPALRVLLQGHGDLYVRLLENPYLHEHESFTDLLVAILHLKEELENRGGFKDLPLTDYTHLSGDIQRVYGQLVWQWLAYMQHLKGNYPFLFSLAMRKNPFDNKASAIVYQ